MNPSLVHSLRLLADRLPDVDARLLWRAANQLEAMQALMEPAKSAKTLRQVRDLAERRYLAAVLIETGDNHTRTAERLGISRVALYKFLRKHGLKPPRTSSGLG